MFVSEFRFSSGSGVLCRWKFNKDRSTIDFENFRFRNPVSKVCSTKSNTRPLSFYEAKSILAYLLQEKSEEKLRGYFPEGETRRSRIGECILKVARDRRTG